MGLGRIKKTITYLILVAFVVILIFPFIWLLINSLKYPEDVFGRVSLLPVSKDGEFYATLDNYTKAIDYLNFPLLFKNTLFVCIINTFVNLLCNTMAGYSFARMRFKGSELIFKILLTSLMIPGTVMLIPNMIIIQKIGMYDSLWALILPFVMSVYNVFLMKQHFLSHSKEIEEAAVIDGASWFTIFFRIALPQAKPIMTILGIYTFMWNYSNFLWPLVMLNDSKKFTLARGLGKLMTGDTINFEKYGMMLASSVMIAVPLITLFMIFQKSIIKGINIGGLKE